MPEFTIIDKRHLEAAEGWLGLGIWQEANEELEHLTPQLRSHPEVLGVRFQIYAKAEKWEYAIEICCQKIHSGIFTSHTASTN